MPIDDDPKPFIITRLQEGIADENRLRSQNSLDAVIFVFQILMSLAMANAAFLFLTNSNGNSYILRPLESISFSDTLISLGFATLVILFIHGDVLVLRQAYRGGFTGKRLLPLVDFFLLFIHSALFYALSHTFAELHTNPLRFFSVLLPILVINIFWAVITFIFDSSRRIAIRYAFQNTVAVFLGLIIFALKPPHLIEGLAILLLLRNICDFVINYDFLFPGAFKDLGA